MDEIRRVEQAISDEEARVLAARVAAAESERRRTLVLLALGTVAAIAAALFANLILADASADEAHARAALPHAWRSSSVRGNCCRVRSLPGRPARGTGTCATNRMTWSDVHEMMFGYKPGGFSGDPTEFFAKVHPDDRAALISAIDRARDERVEYAHEFRVEPTPV